MTDIVLKTTQLTKAYSRHLAVDSMDMTIQRGDIYGFIGKNGAGKTTLLRMITSLVRPTSGTIALFGSHSAQDLEKARRQIGSIIETPAFFPKMNARDNLDYYRIQRGMKDPGAIERALNSVNLVETGKKQYRHFSLGMKQRLGLALAIMGNPEFLILDEPINGLDPTGIIEFRNIILRLHSDHPDFQPHSHRAGAGGNQIRHHTRRAAAQGTNPGGAGHKHQRLSVGQGEQRCSG